MRVIGYNEEEESYFLDLINNPRKYGFNHRNIKGRLIDFANEFPRGSRERNYLDGRIDSFNEIILLRPFEIQDLIFEEHHNYGNNIFTHAFNLRLLQVLSYHNIQKGVLKEFFVKKNIRSCPYCNTQYTLNVRSSDRLSIKYQLDHIFPKTKYPIFSISLYNLIPCCANCNLRKSDSDFFMTDYIHPYNESFDDLTKFYVNDKNILSLIEKKEPFKISLTNKSSKRVKNQIEIFDLEKIYENFRDEARELNNLNFILNNGNIDFFLNLKDDKGKLIFSSREDVLSTLIRANLDIGSDRPLSKFTKDLLRYSDFNV